MSIRFTYIIHTLCGIFRAIIARKNIDASMSIDVTYFVETLPCFEEVKEHNSVLLSQKISFILFVEVFKYIILSILNILSI